jgi:hypothetical protein
LCILYEVRAVEQRYQLSVISYQFQAKPKSHGWGTDYRTYNLKLVLPEQKLNPTLEVLSCQS